MITLAATAQGKFLPQTGAVLIKDAAGNIVGSAGASGGTGERGRSLLRPWRRTGRTQSRHLIHLETDRHHG